MNRISALWNRGWLGKALVSLGALVVSCCLIGVFAARRTPPTPAAQPVAVTIPTAPPATAAPSAAPATSVPTPAPPAKTPTVVPTTQPLPRATPMPTAAPVPTPSKSTARPASAAPQGSDCPADFPIKGNVRQRNPNKGAKIYHVPGDNGYAQTRPEQCFATVTAAAAAGYRPIQP